VLTIPRLQLFGRDIASLPAAEADAAHIAVGCNRGLRQEILGFDDSDVIVVKLET